MDHGTGRVVCNSTALSEGCVDGPLRVPSGPFGGGFYGRPPKGGRALYSIGTI